MFKLDFYQTRLLNFYITIIVLFGAINTGLMCVNINIIEKLKDYFYLDKIVAVIILLCALYLLSKKETVLPFLGESVIPSTLIPLKKNNGNMAINVKVEPNSKVIYWASLPNESNKPQVKEAYGNYSNYGTIMSDATGNAKLTITKGTGYIVPNGKYIKPHIHYRVFNNENPEFVSPVYTVYY
jgi:uncharacterized membrane protein YuzA (DUF378 family)